MKLRKIDTMNKKGSAVDIIVLAVLSFIIIIFFALWIYGFNEITTVMTGLGSTGGQIDINLSQAGQDTFGQINSHQTTGLHILAYAMIFSMALSVLISNFLIKVNPVFFVLYVFILITAFIISVYLSNQYEILMQNPIYGSAISGFKGGSFIMLYLPVWISVIGAIGIVLLLSGIYKDYNLGGGVA